MPTMVRGRTEDINIMPGTAIIQPNPIDKIDIPIRFTKNPKDLYRFMERLDVNGRQNGFIAFMPNPKSGGVSVFISTKEEIHVMNLYPDGANEMWREGRQDGYVVMTDDDGYARLTKELGIYGLPSVLVPLRLFQDVEPEIK